jgi:hypothetical protein
MKELLLKLVAEIEDLKANQALLVALVGTGVRGDDAQNAKIASIQSNKTFFDGLRSEIGSL